MGFFDSLFGWGGEDPEAIRQREAGYAKQAADREAAAQQQQLQMQIDYMNQLRSDQAAKDAAAAAKDPTATRSAAMQQINQYFTPEFEQSWLGGTSTDPLEEQIYGEQKQTAQDYLDRLLKRGVITDTGRAAAGKALEDQGARVRTQLNDLSNTLLESERAKLGGFADRARGAASALDVGQGFDVTPYSTGAQQELASFQSGLGDLYRAQVPDNLFDTASLGNIAGGAQFAGNRPFEPDIQPDKYGTTAADTDPFTGQKLVQKRTATVF